MVIQNATKKLLKMEYIVIMSYYSRLNYIHEYVGCLHP